MLDYIKMCLLESLKRWKFYNEWAIAEDDKLNKSILEYSKTIIATKC